MILEGYISIISHFSYPPKGQPITFTHYSFFSHLDTHLILIFSLLSPYSPLFIPYSFSSYFSLFPLYIPRAIFPFTHLSIFPIYHIIYPHYSPRIHSRNVPIDPYYFFILFTLHFSVFPHIYSIFNQLSPIHT